MKKIILFALLAVSATMAMAQINPKSGIIITNSGDTIRGVIDFRTNEKLSKECEFWAEGKTDGKTYKPGDIEGFRFNDNGKYFVTRKLNVDGKPRLYFAEFMVKGMMNLYCVVENSDEHFFFEREDGEMAKLTNKAFYTSSTLADEKANIEEMKEQFGKVKFLLKDSWTAIEDMNKPEVSRKQLVNVVRDYHKDVCTDGSTCVVYEYNEKSDRSAFRFKVFTGFVYYSTERTELQYPILLDESYPGCAFEFGLGFETEIDRLLKGGSVEMGIVYSPKAKSEHNVMVIGGAEPSRTVYEKGRVFASLGVVKRFVDCKWRFTPLVRGGGFAGMNFGNHESRYYESRQIFDAKYSTKVSHYGVYLGAGVQMAVGKHFARLHADWYKSLEHKATGEMTKWGITAEFGL